MQLSENRYGLRPARLHSAAHQLAHDLYVYGTFHNRESPYWYSGNRRTKSLSSELPSNWQIFTFSLNPVNQDLVVCKYPLSNR